jgi:hypothetical protein
LTKAFCAALCAAAIIAWAGPVGAVGVVASLAGSFNDDPLHSGWRATWIYDVDPSLVADTTTLFNGSPETRLSWTSASADPAPLHSLSVDVFGAAPITFLATEFTSFTVHRSNYDYVLSASGLGFSFDIGFAPAVQYPLIAPLGADLGLDQAYAHSFQPPAFGSYGHWSLNSGLPETQYLAVSVTPEPATWGLLILGFGGLGTALRRRRTRLAPSQAA